MKSSRLFEAIGSPLDSLRSGKRERAAQFGLCNENEESFECNQSFPRALQMPSKLKANDFSPDINRIKCYGLSSVSFLKQNLIKNHNNSLNHNRANYLNDTTTGHNHSNVFSFDKSWAFYNHLASSNAFVREECEPSAIVAVTNPNKAMVVINGRTTEILTANNISCELFGYSEGKIIGKKLKDLLDLSENGNDAKKQDLLMESDRLDENGKIVLCNGKIFEAITYEKNESRMDDDEERPEDWTECNTEENEENKSNNRLLLPISMYMLKLTDEAEPKCLCVMEPVQRITGTFAINVKGRVRYYNSNFSYIFGYTNMGVKTSNESPNNNTSVSMPCKLATLSASSLLVDKDINELMPHMKIPISTIPAEIRKQMLTGRTCSGENISLKVAILNKQVCSDEIVYNCSASVYTNISGLVTVNPSTFLINSYNSAFARLIFGYDDKELLNKPITHLIPNFFEPDSFMQKLTNAKNTPLGVNNSYLNVPANFSINNKQKHLNASGSFIENKANDEDMVGKIEIVPVENELNKTLETDAVVVDIERSSFMGGEKAESCCNCRMRRELEAAKKQRETELICEFNVKSADYSPNQKCANYIEENSFSAAATTNSNGAINSSVRKSLLAKAISNHSESKSNLSMEDLSILSSSSSMSSSSSLGCLTSPSEDKSNQMSRSRSLSHVNVSEFEGGGGGGGEGSWQDEACPSCKRKKANESKSNTIQEVSGGANQADASEMSLIAIDEDYAYSQANTNMNNNKRKASLSSERRGSLLLDNCPKTGEKSKKFKSQVTSTPAAAIAASSKLAESKYQNSMPTISNVNDGMFFGRGKHSDASFIRVIYQRRMVKLNERENNATGFGDASNIGEEASRNNKLDSLICVWISRDPYSDKSLLDFSVDQSMLFKQKKLNQTLPESNAYSAEYEDITNLGRGASGFVQLARRKLDRFEVVTKYILKSKIYKDNWIEDTRYVYGKIPLECSILCKLDHANIIKVLEVFQDDEYVQMVMEKHGCGMDLFEFIDRQRKYIEEGLASYIFRQIASAVAYLHGNNIVHRDIKDENIVIDQNFHVKLIDFGSAAYMTKGKKFATFCGTLDYCSPDVLLGNKYYGPELDVWTCGIALYTMVFSENPFLNAEETIECILKPPFKVSKELMKLLFSILCPKPELRATIDEIMCNEWVNQPVDMEAYAWDEVIHDTEFHGNTAGDCNRDEEFAKGNFYIKSQAESQETANNDSSTGERHSDNLNLDKMNLVNSVSQNNNNNNNNDENQNPDDAENVKSNLQKKALNLQPQLAILSKSF